MPMSVHGAIVFGFENKSWLGNRHGRHTSNIQKHFLCLATGKNLVCFSCFCVMLLCSMEQRGHYKRGRKSLPLSSSTNIAWKLLCGDLCDGARCLPVTHQGEDRQPSPSRSQYLVSFSPYMAARGPSAFPLMGRLGIDYFYEMDMTQKSIQHGQPVHLKRVLSCTSHQQVCELLFIRTQLGPADMSLPGKEQQISGSDSHSSWLVLLHGKSEKFLSYKLPEVVK